MSTSSVAARRAAGASPAMRGDLRAVRLPRAAHPEQPARADGRTGEDAALLRLYWTGLPWQLGCAAFWESLAADVPPPASHRLGGTLREEVGACLLGGHGMPYWLANAAFVRLQSAGVFSGDGSWSPDDIESLLSRPLRVGDQTRRYRFPRQRAGRIHAALAHLSAGEIPVDDIGLRDFLLRIPGIGPKTAGWVVRNYRDSDRVAIIDIHLIRAGTVAGVFAPTWRVARDYDLYEAAFLDWADGAAIRPSHLDAVIWGVLARDSRAARDILGVTRLGDSVLEPVWPT